MLVTKMLNNTLFVFIIVCFLSGFSNGEINAEFYLKDYTYINALNSFYKIHKTPQTWSDAKLECAQEGASLFYPENEDEQNAVLSFLKSTKPDVWWVYLGISDLTTEGVFETVDGNPLSEVYSNWKPNEPNDANGEENCVEQDTLGKMNDVKCSQKFSFICKKKLPSVKQNNSCNTDGERDKAVNQIDYTYIETVNSFYKIHTTPQTWPDAKLVCALEGTSLFYPENKNEQTAVMLFLNTTEPKVRWVYLGISDLTTEGEFETVDGKPLSEVYSNWKSNEPNNADGEENCVEQDNEGKMNDVTCLKKFSFICKKGLPTVQQNNSCSTNRTDKDVSGKDYTYIETVNSFYKIHETQQNWSDAKLECAQEGASLFYPENDDEQNAVLSFLKSTKPDVWWVYLGISDLTTEGVFETIDGEPLSEVYSNWKPNEPNNRNGEENCVEQDYEGKMNDVKCSKEFSFICKKSLSSVEQNNSCNTNRTVIDVTGKDYTYIETVNSFYKIHETQQNWSDAKLECAQEGASLFYPENDDEQNAVLSFLKSTKPDVWWVYLGISDLTTEGVFETVDGKPLSEVYSNWKPNEPNNRNGEENCVEQDNEGKMNDVICSKEFSFICKKSLPSVEQNNTCSTNRTVIDVNGKDYTYIETVNSFYKIHTTPQNWSDAMLDCAQEGASLFYPENDDEQNAVMSFLNTTQPKVRWVFVGISDLMNEGVFETIDGKPLSEGYSNWKPNEPNNADGEENCVEQDNTGKMNDVKCSKEFSFICKKKLPSLEEKNTPNIDGPKDQVVFRKDFTYIETVNSFYKIHTTPQNWSDAKLNCTQEGASLFYPENDDEQNVVMSFLNTTQPKVRWVFVGISDLMNKGVFETIDGKPLSEGYSNWKPNEPNNLNGEEDCVEQDNTGKMNDVNCSKKFPFICRKKLSSPEENNTPNTDGPKDIVFFRKDYTYIEAVNNFYKIHTELQTWSDAKLECALEGASLFFPTNDEEQIAVMSFQNTTEPDVKRVFLGISNKRSQGIFETVTGRTLVDDNKWLPDDPKDDNGEDCLQQDNVGELNYGNCSEKLPFICKKSLLQAEWNTTCNLGYFFNQNTFKCYKLHATRLKWAEAYAVCRSEEAHLAVINNRMEGNNLATLIAASKQRIEGNHQLYRGIFHLGFRYSFKEGWRTVRGTPFKADDDVWWNKNQPIIDENPQCGSVFYNGRLHSVDCDTKSFFICEHDVDSTNFTEEMFQ